MFCCWFSFFCRTFAVWKRSKMAEKKKCRDDKSRHCFVTMNCVCIHHTVDSIAEITGSSAMYCEVSSWSRDSQLVAVRLGWIHCCSALEECIFVSSVDVIQSRLFKHKMHCLFNVLLVFVTVYDGWRMPAIPSHSAIFTCRITHFFLAAKVLCNVKFDLHVPYSPWLPPPHTSDLWTPCRCSSSTGTIIPYSFACSSPHPIVNFGPNHQTSSTMIIKAKRRCIIHIMIHYQHNLHTNVHTWDCVWLCDVAKSYISSAIIFVVVAFFGWQMIESTVRMPYGETQQYAVAPCIFPHHIFLQRHAAHRRKSVSDRTYTCTNTKWGQFSNSMHRFYIWKLISLWRTWRSLCLSSSPTLPPQHIPHIQG